MASLIDKNKLTKICLGILFFIWFSIVYLFSSQTGRESSQVSEKVTRELLKIKDTLSVVIENYQDTNEIVLKRNPNQSHYKHKNR